MAFHPLTARPLAMFTLNRIPFHAGTKSYPVECEHYPTCHCHSPLKRSLRRSFALLQKPCQNHCFYW